MRGRSDVQDRKFSTAKYKLQNQGKAEEFALEMLLFKHH